MRSNTQRLELPVAVAISAATLFAALVDNIAGVAARIAHYLVIQRRSRRPAPPIGRMSGLQSGEKRPNGEPRGPADDPTAGIQGYRGPYRACHLPAPVAGFTNHCSRSLGPRTDGRSWREGFPAAGTVMTLAASVFVVMELLVPAGLQGLTGGQSRSVPSPPPPRGLRCPPTWHAQSTAMRLAVRPPSAGPCR